MTTYYSVDGAEAMAARAARRAGQVVDAIVSEMTRLGYSEIKVGSDGFGSFVAGRSYDGPWSRFRTVAEVEPPKHHGESEPEVMSPDLVKAVRDKMIAVGYRQVEVVRRGSKTHIKGQQDAGSVIEFFTHPNQVSDPFGKTRPSRPEDVRIRMQLKQHRDATAGMSPAEKQNYVDTVLLDPFRRFRD